MAMGRREGDVIFPCYLNMSLPNVSRQSSFLGICLAPLRTEACTACLEMTGGAKMALRMPAVRVAKLDFTVIYQSWRPPRVTAVLLLLLRALVCLTFLMLISFPL